MLNSPSYKPNTGYAARREAIRVLIAWLRDGDFPSRSVNASLTFAVEIVQGVLRNLSALDFAIGKFCRKPPEIPARAALLAGAWQLICSSGKIPPYAAIGETVQAVKGLQGIQAGFINAVLRNIARNEDLLRKEIASAPLHIRLSHPPDLVEYWRKCYGNDTTEALCEAGSGIPPTFAYAMPRGEGFSGSFKSGCNSAVASAAETLAAIWRSSGIAIPDDAPLSDGRIPLPHGIAVSSLPGYSEGTFIIQDPAAFDVVHSVLRPVSGETILDCCAAPGGKSLQIAFSIGAEGHLYALDSSEARLKRLRENFARAMPLCCVDISLCDAVSASLIERFSNISLDAILIDAPCSNSGVFARRPDARWRWSSDDANALSSLQQEMLGNAASLGPQRIVYSTCSIDPHENENVVRSFLSTPDCRYSLTTERILLPIANPRQFSRFLPATWHDGSYAALLTRTKR